MRAAMSLRVGLVAAALATGLVACSSPTVQQDEKPTTLALRTYYIPGSWDPVNAGVGMGETAPGEAVYESLIMGVSSTEYTPWLAESYELSDDRLSVTMQLRTDVDFTDGVHMNAAAIERFFDAFLQGPVDGVLGPEYGTDVVATGEYSLELTTTVPVRNSWWQALSYVPIASFEALNDPDSLAVQPVGTGPYLLDEYVPESSATFVRNPDYWNAEAYDFDRVAYQIYVDDIAALNALKSGQLDTTVLGQIPLAVEAEAAGFGLFPTAGYFPSLFIIDRLGELVPALADVRVRQAMNLAFDREGINESLNLGRGAVSSQPFLKGEALYVEGGDDRYAFDLDRARQLMAEAGYADGFDLTIPTLSGYTKPYEPVLQQSLADIGIRVTYEVYPDTDAGKVLGELWPSGDYPVAAYTFVPYDTLTWIERLWGGFKTEEAIALFDTVKHGDLEESERAERELGELILDEAWFVPFSFPPTFFAARPGIHIEVSETSALYPKLSQYSVE
jgi:peptide/nickel transport system substrate-binding protein